MAPEYVVHGQLTEKADIYGYGILVLEMITGRKNSSPSASGEGYSLMSLVSIFEFSLQSSYFVDNFKLPHLNHFINLSSFIRFGVIILQRH